MLSLVNAPAACFDLVRLDGGAVAADVLAAGLAAGPAELTRLEALAVDRGPSSLSAALDEVIVRPTAGPTTRSDRDLPGALEALVRTPVCGIDPLVGLLRDDVLGWTRSRAGGVGLGGVGVGGVEVGGVEVQRWPAALGAFVDALHAALAGPRLDASVADDLLRPFRTARLPVDCGDLGPNDGQVRAALAAVVDASPRELTALGDAHRHQTGWALAMHRACWAVHLSGRERPAAAAQFAVARVLARRDDRQLLAAGGTVAAVSAALHGEMVGDLLDEDSLTRLLAPWRTTFG